PAAGPAPALAAQHDLFQPADLVRPEGQRRIGPHLDPGPAVLVVAGGDHGHARRLERELGEIGGRRQGEAEVQHLAAAFQQAEDQGLFDAQRIGPEVVADHDPRRRPGLVDVGRQTQPQGLQAQQIDLLAQDPARVVLAKAGRLDQGVGLVGGGVGDQAVLGLQHGGPCSFAGQMTPARSRSWTWRIPTGLPSSTTNNTVMLLSFISFSASAASVVEATVRGLAVMIWPALWPSRASSMWRRRSPSVTSPVSRPASSTTPSAPKRFSLITSRPSRMGVSARTSGRSACIRSPTVRSMAPSLPPGWKVRKSPAVKPRRSIRATARASPRAICRVVEVVGASTPAAASGASGISSTTVDWRARALSGRAVMPSSGTPNLWL